jgi:5'-3' exonuclease
MGINSLWEILKQHACGEEISLADLCGRIMVGGRCCVAIDAYVIYHKYFCATWKWSVESSSFSYDTVIVDCVKKIDDMAKMLKRNGIDQLWCADGRRNEEKLATERRGDKRDMKLLEIAEMHKACVVYCEMNPEETLSEQQILSRFDFLEEYWPNFAEEDIDESFDLRGRIGELKRVLSKYPLLTPIVRRAIQNRLERMGHSFFVIPEISEGEKLCSIAVKMGLCQAVLSSDSDLIPMGTSCVIKEIKDGIASVFTYNDVITKLGMTYKQLMSLCIMLGSDFNDGIEGMGKVKCLSEVMSPGFDIFEFDRSHCGVLRVNICLAALSISEREYRLVKHVVESRFLSQRASAAQES